MDSKFKRLTHHDRLRKPHFFHAALHSALWRNTFSFDRVQHDCASEYADIKRRLHSAIKQWRLYRASDILGVKRRLRFTSFSVSGRKRFFICRKRFYFIQHFFWD